MPCYKAGAYIYQALEAVEAQTYTHWEIIAVDDCGPEDGTKDIIKAFADKFPLGQVRFIQHDENKGVSAARNTAIKNAKGDFIALLDPDDFWTDKHLEQGIAHFSQDNELFFYSSYAYLFNDNNPNHILGIEGYKNWEIKAFPHILSIKNSIPASSCILQKTVFETVGFFDEDRALQHVEDYDLWVRILAHNLKSIINPEPTIYYRKHANAATSNSGKMFLAKANFEKKHKDWLVLYRREALEKLTQKIKSIDDANAAMRERMDKLEQRINILEKTNTKFKNLPVIKQLLMFKATFKTN